MLESPGRCNENFGSESEVKREAKMSFNLILQIFFLISQTTQHYKVLREHVQFL